MEQVDAVRFVLGDFIEVLLESDIVVLQSGLGSGLEDLLFQAGFLLLLKVLELSTELAQFLDLHSPLLFLLLVVFLQVLED